MYKNNFNDQPAGPLPITATHDAKGFTDMIQAGTGGPYYGFVYHNVDQRFKIGAEGCDKKVIGFYTVLLCVCGFLLLTRNPTEGGSSPGKR